VLDDPHAYADVMGRLAAAGYPAVDPPEDPVAEDQRLHQQLGRRWKQAALISAPLVLIEMTRHLAPGLPLIPEGGRLHGKRCNSCSPSLFSRVPPDS